MTPRRGQRGLTRATRLLDGTGLLDVVAGLEPVSERTGDNVVADHARWLVGRGMRIGDGECGAATAAGGGEDSQCRRPWGKNED